jgi:hypothetical protein
MNSTAAANATAHTLQGHAQHHVNQSRTELNPPANPQAALVIYLVMVRVLNSILGCD